MTTIAGGASLTQQLYGGLFERLNTDADDAVSFAELGAVGGISARDAEAAFKALDADGDGRVVRSEMAPADRFALDTINAMLIAQAGATSENDRKVVADLFARADLDGDGALSADEMDAERALRRAASLDAGYNPDHIFLAKDADGDGLLRSDEVEVGRLARLQPGAAQFSEDMITPATWRPLRTGEGGQMAPIAPRSPEDRQKLLDQLAADQVERASGPAGTYRYLTRELGEMRAAAGADFAAAPMTDALAARLMQQVLQGWGESPATDISA